MQAERDLEPRPEQKTGRQRGGPFRLTPASGTRTLLRLGGTGSKMQLVIFFVLWIVFSLGIPMALHLLFANSLYPLVSIGAVIGFVGGALLSALITGLFIDN
jgi:hypothetical protein